MRKFCSFCLALLMSASLLCAPAMAADEDSLSPSDELICEMGRFISDAVIPFGDDFTANNYDALQVGNAIPYYSVDQGSDSVRLCTAQYYPIFADTQIIGLMGVFPAHQGNYRFSYSEGYSERINSVLADDTEIAMLWEGAQSKIITASNLVLAMDSSGVEEGLADLRFADPYEKLYDLDITDIAHVPSAHGLPNGHTLSVPTKYRSEWWDCWAACTASVGQYYTDIRKSSLQVAEEISYYRPAGAPKVKSALKSIYGIDVFIEAASPSILDVEEAIYYDESPFIVGLKISEDDAVGHMIVIKGYAVGTYHTSLSIMDPEDGPGVVSISISNPIEIPLYGEIYKVMEYVV